MDILRIEHLTKTYGDGDTAVRALDDVSFSVAAGEFVAIIGSSGSGKSTLLHMIGGVDRPTSGTVYLNGENVFERSDEQLAVFRRREVGLVYQFYNLVPVLDVVENMCLPVLMDGRKVNERRLADLIEPEPERTCRDVGNNDKFVCSECGARFDYEGWYDDPTYWVDDVAAAVKYCPNCRAMVIYGDNR